MEELKSTKADFPVWVDIIADGQEALLLRDTHADLNNEKIEPAFSLLLLVWGLVNDAEAATFQVKVEANGWSGKEFESLWYVVPTSVIVDALCQTDTTYDYTEQESLQIQQRTFELLAYIFDATAQQLDNDLAMIGVMPHLVKKLEAKLFKTADDHAKLAQIYQELTPAMVKATRTLRAMTELQKSAEISHWLNMRVESEQLRQAKGIATEFYLSFLQSLQKGYKIIS